MSTTAVLEANAGDILREGWRALVDTIGIQKATRFVVLLERGKGDSVQEIAQYWGDSSIDEIHRQVSEWTSKKT
jgi:hypothetical protein